MLSEDALLGELGGIEVLLDTHVRRVIHSSAGASVLTADGTILCFYGRSKDVHFAGDRLTLARIPWAWIASAEELETNRSPSQTDLK